jgi:hypothetical protein
MMEANADWIDCQMTKEKKETVSWNGVKAGLRDFDRTALLGLIQDLYAASKDNQAFLHARFSLGADPLKPYKAIISRWVCPDIVLMFGQALKRTLSLPESERAASRRYSGCSRENRLGRERRHGRALVRNAR